MLTDDESTVQGAGSISLFCDTSARHENLVYPRFGAGGRTRTDTTFYGPRILSPVRLPFRHTGGTDYEILKIVSVEALTLCQKLCPVRAWKPMKQQVIRKTVTTAKLSQRFWMGASSRYVVYGKGRTFLRATKHRKSARRREEDASRPAW